MRATAAWWFATSALFVAPFLVLTGWANQPSAWYLIAAWAAPYALWLAAGVVRCALLVPLDWLRAVRVPPFEHADPLAAKLREDARWRARLLRGLLQLDPEDAARLPPSAGPDLLTVLQLAGDPACAAYNPDVARAAIHVLWLMRCLAALPRLEALQARIEGRADAPLVRQLLDQAIAALRSERDDLLARGTLVRASAPDSAAALLRPAQGSREPVSEERLVRPAAGDEGGRS